ncbi:uncharacterized protein LOC131601131 [Vicia villosa]|uniref:uncharacterized protein LOC131601131 n=1 Tax=Vicia villosa TaxID=3911 RepID=UPI00273CAA84|nr:uncharacterized protein LOC131601131 [Vicia villosa]
MALLLRLKTTKLKTHTLTNSPSFHHLFSTSNPGGDGGNNGNKPSSDSLADALRDLRNSLKQQPSSNTPSPLSSPSSQKSDIVSKIQSYRSATLPEDPSSQKKQISFQDIYSNFRNRSGDSEANAGSEASKPSTPGLEAIRGSLRQLKGTNTNTNPMPSPRWRPSPSSPLFSGTSTTPDSIFGKEIRERLVKVNDPSAASLKNFESVRLYSPNELGEKLKKLRPQVKGKEWFSIAELNERLKKVMEMDETEANSSSSDKGVYNILRNSVNHIKAKDAEKPKIASLQRIDFLSIVGGTPSYMTKPPKEHLVEKYFHPDNMSSAEKLKIELTKVRDEFKMSESDCGSARVQVATLTTKIKHLSSVLHKKDVHSRKGLIAMVQKRKKLLKYLRRTDWDSYCFVISKLGLRDNPEHTYKARTGKSGDVAN